MGTLDGMIVPGYTRYGLDEGEASVTRRTSLKVFANSMSAMARKGNITDIEGFIRVASVAATPFQAMMVQNGTSLADVYCEVYVEDLRRVLIGDGFTTSERNHGQYALRFQAFMDTGFKPEYRDNSNQVQHAMAGIYISFKYGFLGRRFAIHQEDEEPDLRLYDVTFDIGSDLNGSNFTSLPTMLKEKLAM